MSEIIDWLRDFFTGQFLLNFLNNTVWPFIRGLIEIVVLALMMLPLVIMGIVGDVVGIFAGTRDIEVFEAPRAAIAEENRFYNIGMPQGTGRYAGDYYYYYSTVPRTIEGYNSADYYGKTPDDFDDIFFEDGTEVSYYNPVKNYMWYLTYDDVAEMIAESRMLGYLDPNFLNNRLTTARSLIASGDPASVKQGSDLLMSSYFGMPASRDSLYDSLMRDGQLAGWNALMSARPPYGFELPYFTQSTNRPYQSSPVGEDFFMLVGHYAIQNWDTVERFGEVYAEVAIYSFFSHRIVWRDYIQHNHTVVADPSLPFTDINRYTEAAQRFITRNRVQPGSEGMYRVLADAIFDTRNEDRLQWLEPTGSEVTTLLGYFMGQPFITRAFWGITAIALALCIGFSILAVVRSMGDLQQNRPLGRVVGSIGKAMLTFLLIPFLCITAISLTSVVMRQVEELFRGESIYGEPVSLEGTFLYTAVQPHHVKLYDVTTERKQVYVGKQPNEMNEQEYAEYIYNSLGRNSELESLFKEILPGTENVRGKLPKGWIWEMEALSLAMVEDKIYRQNSNHLGDFLTNMIMSVNGMVEEVNYKWSEVYHEYDYAKASLPFIQQGIELAEARLEENSYYFEDFNAQYEEIERLQMEAEPEMAGYYYGQLVLMSIGRGAITDLYNNSKEALQAWEAFLESNLRRIEKCEEFFKLLLEIERVAIMDVETRTLIDDPDPTAQMRRYNELREDYMFGRTEVSFSNMSQIREDFYVFDMFFVGTGFFSMIVSWFMVIMLIMVILVFIRRIFEVVLLYIVSPFFVSVMPLDDGKRFDSWRDMFVSRLLAGFGSLFTLNVFLLMLPMIWTPYLQLSGSSFVDTVLKLLFTVGGIYTVYKSQHLISQIINPQSAASEQGDTGLMGGLMWAGAGATLSGGWNLLSGGKEGMSRGGGGGGSGGAGAASGGGAGSGGIGGDGGGGTGGGNRNPGLSSAMSGSSPLSGSQPGSSARSQSSNTAPSSALGASSSGIGSGTGDSSGNSSGNRNPGLSDSSAMPSPKEE